MPRSHDDDADDRAARLDRRARRMHTREWSSYPINTMPPDGASAKARGNPKAMADWAEANEPELHRSDSFAPQPARAGCLMCATRERGDRGGRPHFGPSRPPRGDDDGASRVALRSTRAERTPGTPRSSQPAPWTPRLARGRGRYAGAHPPRGNPRQSRQRCLDGRICGGIPEVHG